MGKVGHFLRSCVPFTNSHLDLKELALSVSTDPDHRFDLAVGLNDLETALSLVRASPEAGSQAKWKVVGDKALAAWQLDLAQESFEKAGDLPALLLLFSSLSDRSGMERLAKTATSRGQNNIAFAAYLQLGDAASCIELLSSTGRLPEAALFARSYNPVAISGVVKAWRAELEDGGKGKLAQTIADPEEDGELFTEGWSGSGVPDGEGSGVMVEKEDVSEEEGKGIVDSVKEPVEDLAEMVKEIVVGNGEENGEEAGEVKGFEVDSPAEQEAEGPSPGAVTTVPAGKKKGGKKK